VAFALANIDGQLIAGGLAFPGIETVFAWTGSEWRPLAGGPTIHAQTPLIPQVHALAGFDDELFAGGGFTHVGEQPSAFVARAVCEDCGVVQPPRRPTAAAGWVRAVDAGKIEVLDALGTKVAEAPFVRPNRLSDMRGPSPARLVFQKGP
jgi:hypothetical protein